MDEGTLRTIAAGLGVLGFGLGIFNTIHNIRKDRRDRRDKEAAKAAANSVEFECRFQATGREAGSSALLELTLSHVGGRAVGVEPCLMLCGPSVGQHKRTIEFIVTATRTGAPSGLLQPGENRTFHKIIGPADVPKFTDDDMVQLVVRYPGGEWSRDVGPELMRALVYGGCRWVPGLSG